MDAGFIYLQQSASDRNAQLVEGKTVYLEKDVSETDRYGRLPRYVWLKDGSMVNATLVAEGYAQATGRVGVCIVTSTLVWVRSGRYVPTGR